MPLTIADYIFEGPFLRLNDIRNLRGVFAVVCMSERGSILLVDVGESEEMRDAVRLSNKKDCWLLNCKGSIAVAVLYTPDLDRAGRMDIVEIIRRREFVPCGGETPGSGE